MDDICKRCIHSIFCPIWSEYKCKASNLRFVKRSLFQQFCSSFSERPVQFEEPKCRCNTCEEVGMDVEEGTDS